MDPRPVDVGDQARDPAGVIGQQLHLELANRPRRTRQSIEPDLRSADAAE